MYIRILSSNETTSGRILRKFVLESTMLLSSRSTREAVVYARVRNARSRYAFGQMAKGFRTRKINENEIKSIGYTNRRRGGTKPSVRGGSGDETRRAHGPDVSPKRRRFRTDEPGRLEFSRRARIPRTRLTWPGERYRTVTGARTRWTPSSTRPFRKRAVLG